MVFKAGEGAGASGSFFFFSFDGKFLIKTLRGEEKEILLNMLPSFIDHLKQNNNQSLIAKIYGCYTIKTNQFKAVHIIVMENTARLISPTNHKLIFDMKGSSVNRFSKQVKVMSASSLN